MQRANIAASDVEMPRRIHQLWIPPADMTSIPDDVFPQTVAWREAHPDFHHRLWSIEEIAQALPPSRAERMMRAVNVSRFEAMKADIARLYLLAEFGGFWSDLKVYPRRPWLTEHLDKHLVLVEHFRSDFCKDPTGILINNMIGSIPHHPYIEACIERVHENIDRRMTETIWNIAGPKMYMDVLSEWKTTRGDIPKIAIIASDCAWEDLLNLGHGSYSANHRHWSYRQEHESIYMD